MKLSEILVRKNKNGKSQHGRVGTELRKTGMFHLITPYIYGHPKRMIILKHCGPERDDAEQTLIRIIPYLHTLPGFGETLIQQIENALFEAFKRHKMGENYEYNWNVSNR